VRSDDERNDTEPYPQQSIQHFDVHEFHTASSLVPELLNASVLWTGNDRYPYKCALGQDLSIGLVMLPKLKTTTRLPGRRYPLAPFRFLRRAVFHLLQRPSIAPRCPTCTGSAPPAVRTQAAFLRSKTGCCTPGRHCRRQHRRCSGHRQAVFSRSGNETFLPGGALGLSIHRFAAQKQTVFSGEFHWFCHQGTRPAQRRKVLALPFAKSDMCGVSAYNCKQNDSCEFSMP
jgi:hypothetical protein